MNRTFISALIACIALFGYGQEKKFKFKFYGQIRADLFYNSRTNYESADGIFYSYPKDRNFDADGKDLNGTPQSNFYAIYTRGGVDIDGPMLGKVKPTAKIEIDFRGSGSTIYLPRLRHAYINLDWNNNELLFGQTWHPLFGDVSPSVINLNTGAPFQPFSRAPMIRYRRILSRFVLTGAAVWQSQFLSAGPQGKSNLYIKNGCVPEFFVGANYEHGGLICGIGGEVLTLKPRTVSEVDGKQYKVNERITTGSGEAHAKYQTDKWRLSGKVILANNLTQVSMLGGYAVTAKDPRTGECKYSPFHHVSSWLNFVYGKKWQPGVFVGYTKNLGTGKPIVGETYGEGVDVDQLFGGHVQLSYNYKALKVGIEVGASTAWYGSLDKQNGKIVSTHAVTNFRVHTSVIYSF